jgi:hypothetical protein
MNQQEALAVEREALVARSAMQRNAIIAGIEPLLRQAATLDRVVGLVRGSRKIFDIATRLLTVYMLVRRR